VAGNLYLMKASRLSTKKRDLKMNRKDAQIAGKRESSKEAADMAAMATREAGR
jgi:hypothetical protein